ncbi:alanine racemase [Mycetocola manganoxydans]|uniref:Alanine racemase n=1 Tax=Mycetocola manganoxydans TaxID=699879 RepID=A0A3L6ZVZ6_9MICO|nr:alanine racemase [Mycetocola manganoxydans]RLP72020.1 alanine racemase [Mycetocola manganoxydans]GHD47574.1 alanine racemase [Mycetocola manganoxydans]
MTAFREALVDLGAVTANIRTLRARIGTHHLLAVVKADAYGHGAVPVARAALEGGADWLGTADITEALALRSAGIDAPLLCWLHEEGADFSAAVREGIDLGASSAAQLDAVARAAGTSRAAVHLKLDTGLSRNGVAEADWAAVFDHARRLEEAGSLSIRGIFSHLSNASAEDDRAAVAVFRRGLALAENAGLRPDLVHLAATAAAIDLPDARFNTVRIGIGMYGLSPFDDRSSADLGLVPAMTLMGRIAAVRRLPAGSGVSYSYTYRTQRESTLALVPLGYADGVPRQASGAGHVVIAGSRFPVAGRIAMDQFVVDVGDLDVAVGDDVILFGDPVSGVPSATEWAEAAGTINYEIVTRIGARVERRYVR